MKERKREIGYLRSLGFEKFSIYTSLVNEILILSVISGLISSIIVICSLPFILSILSREFLFPVGVLNFWIVLRIIVAGPILSFGLGIISSFVPAIKTAKMEPREAMSRGEI